MDKQSVHTPLSSSETKILSLLSKSEFTMTAHDVAEVLEMSYQTTTRGLANLAKRKLAKRWPGTGHSYKYSFLKWDELASPATHSVQPMPVDLFNNYVLRMRSPRYTPRVTQEAHTVVDSVFTLRDLANKLSQGNKLSYDELDEVKRQLEEHRQVVAAWYHLVSSLLLTSKLWDYDTLSEYAG